MAFTLDDYLDNYIQHADEFDKKVALHLKEIIPKTVHLDQKVFNAIVAELKKETDNEKDFKAAFHKVSEKYILKGDIIKAELPRILTRIILNKTEFIIYIKNQSKVPYSEQDIGIILTSQNKELISEILGEAKLSKRRVVFTTFDEKRKDGNPFKNRKVIDIIKMLALNPDVFQKGEAYSVIKIRYQNSQDLLKKYPTFIDAGWWDRFYPADKSDNYGRTRTLEDLSPAMPEVVHENTKIFDVLEDIEFLEDNNGINKTAGDR